VEALVKIRVDKIKIVGVRPIFMSRVDTIVRRVQRGQQLGPITVNGTCELLEGEHELHAARRLKLDEVEVVIKEQP
jgi:ParB-like chromosome segregation protein Spo0J